MNAIDRAHLPIMSDSASKEASGTATAVKSTQEAEVPATHSEKHNSTSRSTSLHSQPIPEKDPVLEEPGFVAVPSEKADDEAVSSKRQPTPELQGNDHLKEKSATTIEGKGPETSVGQKDVDTSAEESGKEGLEETEIVYPGGLQLGLLTFGLCVATFTVALGVFYSLTSPLLLWTEKSRQHIGCFGCSTMR